jgi:hypothetical protein
MKLYFYDETEKLELGCNRDSTSYFLDRLDDDNYFIDIALRGACSKFNGKSSLFYDRYQLDCYWSGIDILNVAFRIQVTTKSSISRNRSIP